MNGDLIAVANTWRAIMPLVPHHDLAGVHPHLVNDIYPLTVADVYLRTYTCLMSDMVANRLKQPVIAALGQNNRHMHKIHLHLPPYTYTTADRNNHWAWTKAHQNITDAGSSTVHTQAGTSLFNIGIFLAAPSNTPMAPGATDELLYTLGRNDSLPTICAHFVAAAEPRLAR